MRAWNQLSHHLGHHHQIPEATIRAWRLSLLSGNTRCSGTCQTWMRATCNECGHTRCSFSFCPDYLKPCNTCQTIPPSPSSEQGMKTGPATTLSNDLHQVGKHFIEAISEAEPGSVVEGEDPDRTEDPSQLLQNIRFKATIRGWSHRAHQHRATALLSLQNEALVRRMHESMEPTIASPRAPPSDSRSNHQSVATFVVERQHEMLGYLSNLDACDMQRMWTHSMQLLVLPRLSQTM